MTTLAGGLRENDFYAEALAIYESRLGTLERLDLDSHIEDMILTAKTNIAACLTDLGRNDEAFEMKKFIYDRKKKLYGSSDTATLVSATHLYASWDNGNDAYLVERQSFARKQSRVARRALGPDHEITLRLRSQYARSLLIRSSTPPRSDWLEAIEVAEDVVETSRRVLGTSHPLTMHFQEMLERAKELVRIATSSTLADASPEPVDGPANPAPAKP